MGWIDSNEINRVYDACQSLGIELYQEWIMFYPSLYRQLTTTVHSDYANRLLRNKFRMKFNIDMVVFPPDQYNSAYIAQLRDRWFVLSDWSNLSIHATNQRSILSTKVKECEWIAIVSEEFNVSASKIHFIDLIGPHLAPAGALRSPLARPDLSSFFMKCYLDNRAKGTNPPSILLVRP